MQHVTLTQMAEAMAVWIRPFGTNAALRCLRPSRPANGASWEWLESHPSDTALHRGRRNQLASTGGVHSHGVRQGHSSSPGAGGILDGHSSFAAKMMQRHQETTDFCHTLKSQASGNQDTGEPGYGGTRIRGNQETGEPGCGIRQAGSCSLSQVRWPDGLIRPA